VRGRPRDRKDRPGTVSAATAPLHRWDAEDYAANSSAQYQWAQELIASLGLRGGESVLDIGCGDGRVSAAIAARVPRGRVLGIDSSPQMIERARSAFPSGAFPLLEFRLMDGQAIALEERFDIAFSSATLHWVPDHPAVLAGVSRCLVQGGRLLFQMGGRGNAAEVVGVLESMIAGEPWSRFFAGFSFPYSFCGPEQYASWLPAAGLTPRRLALVAKDMRQDGTEGLAGWIRTTWLPHTECVPKAMRDAFVAEVEAEKT